MSTLDQALEAGEVDSVVADLDDVAGRTRLDRIRGLCPVEQLPAQARYRCLDRVRGVLRQVVTPERRDEPVDGDDLIGMKQEQGEGCAGLRPVQRDDNPVAHDLQRSRMRNSNSGTPLDESVGLPRYDPPWAASTFRAGNIDASRPIGGAGAERAHNAVSRVLRS